MNTKFLVICEGESECNYLLHLNRFLRELPPPMDSFLPLEFVGLPKGMNAQSFKPKGVGTGEYGKVVQAYKQEYKRSRHGCFLIWIDDDLYVRNDKACGINYINRPTGIPDFSFSVHNFEDYLALHFSDDLFENWKTELGNAGHFSTPLHGESYAECFQKILPGYKKGELSENFIGVGSLRNMIRHLRHLPSMAMGPISRIRTFAEDIADILCQAYPAVFV